jgi:class 3 adenylate cyclase
MGFSAELSESVRRIFASKWEERDGSVVPESEDLTLANSAVKLHGTVLYADIHGSTQLVDGYKAFFAAEVYKAYLLCAARIVCSEGGAITAYDGDRIMAVFIGGSKNTNAVRTALKINWAVSKVVNPAITAEYPKTSFTLQHVVGVDSSSLYVARTGIRGSNDLVWVGRAANYAAKLATLPPDYTSWITKEVYDNSNNSVKFTNGQAMWEARSWTSMGGASIFRSNWIWRV